MLRPLSILIGLLLAAGCAMHAPVTPEIDVTGHQSINSSASNYADPHHLLGEWTFFINSAHDRVDVVPGRRGGLHLNALKFLESYCADCVKIISIKKNGDSTIDLTVKITHPFPGYPEYTGFDVKGIIMFQGSHEIPNDKPSNPLYPQPYRVSWRLLGDPEILNPDGYSYYWSPWYESGSDMPIFNYWQGKYASGTPTANINGYLNFYSLENRHIFETGSAVTRVYNIWLPPGKPVIAGYAVEACWEPPTIVPVTDPVNDFPITANQPEAYHFHCVLNDGEPMTPDNLCCLAINDSIHETRAEMDFWYLVPESFPDGFWVAAWAPEVGYLKWGCGTHLCDGPSDWRCMCADDFWLYPDGTFQMMALEWHIWQEDSYKPMPYVAVDVFEITIDFQ